MNGSTRYTLYTGVNNQVSPMYWTSMVLDRLPGEGYQ